MAVKQQQTVKVTKACDISEAMRDWLKKRGHPMDSIIYLIRTEKSYALVHNKELKSPLKQDWIEVNEQLHSQLAKKATGKYSTLTYEGEIWAPEALTCLVCPAWNKNGYVMPNGNPTADFVMLGEAPGQQEVLQGKPFVGPAGGLLRKYIDDIDNTYFVNACRCWPPDNAKVECAQCCRNKMWQAVRAHPRKAVFCLGAIAATSVLNTNSKRAVKITTLAGKEQGTSVGRTFFSIHPSACLRGGYEEGKFATTLKHMQKIARGESVEPSVVVLTDESTIPPDCPLAFDTETRNLTAYNTELVGSCLTWDGKNVLESNSIPNALFDSNRLIIGHNLPFDLEVVYSSTGKEIPGKLFDTKIAHHLIDERPPHALAELARKDLEIVHTDFSNYTDLLGFENTPANVLLLKCVEDATSTYLLYAKYAPMLKELGVDELFYDMLMPLSREVGRMYRRGIKLDEEMLFAAEKILQQVDEDLFVQAKKLGLDSFGTKAIKSYIYDKLKIKPTVLTKKTGEPSIGAQALIPLLGKHPIIEVVLRHNSVQKALGTYIKNFIDTADSNGVIHPEFNVSGTTTGRLSGGADKGDEDQALKEGIGAKSTHNIPDVLRGIFRARDGHVMLSSDFGQLELRVLAGLSRDPVLLKAVSEEDVHRGMGAEIFGVPIEQVTDDMRGVGKKGTFTAVYGGQDDKFAAATGLTLEKAHEVRLRLLNRIKIAMKYMSDSLDFCRKNGYIRMMTGRRRHFPDINSQDKRLREAAEREAANSIIQGPAGDITNYALVACSDEYRRLEIPAYCLNQVHDELLYECPIDCQEQAGKILVETMESAYPRLNVPLKANLVVKERWGKASFDINEIADKVYENYLMKQRAKMVEK